jgi:integrase
MGIVKRIGRDGKPQYGVSRRLPRNSLGMRRFRRWYEKQAIAKHVLDRLNGAIATGNINGVLPGLVGAEQCAYTVATFWERFRDEYCIPRLTSWKRYQQSFGFMLAELGQIPLREFRRHHLHEYCEKRIKAVSQSTANKDIAALKKMFSFALEVGAVDNHPLVKFATFKIQEKALRLPTPEEFRALVETQTTPQLQAFVAILGETGMRRNEALNLTWPNLDLRRKRVLAEKTKGKKVRGIPLSDFAVEKLSALTRIVGSPYVFVYDYGSYTGKKLKRPYRAFRTAAKSIGLGWVTFHTLRHYRGTRWLQTGADIRDVQLGLGHSSITTTMRYLKHTETHVDRSLRDAQEREKKDLEINRERDKSGTSEE